MEQVRGYVKKWRQQIRSTFVRESTLFDQPESPEPAYSKIQNLAQYFVELDQDVLDDISLLVALMAALVYVQGLRAMRRRRRDGIIHVN
jgi:hypothetical protein